MQHISKKPGHRWWWAGSWLAALMLMFGVGFAALPAQAATNIALTKTTLQLGEAPVVNGIGFYAYEKISVWLTAPDRTVRAYGTVISDQNGNFSNYSFKAVANLTDQYGFWYITAQGLSSATPTITSFTVSDGSEPPPATNPPVEVPPPAAVTPPPPVEVAPGAPRLGIADNIIRLDELPVVSGTGFKAYERVDLWLTAPNDEVKVYGYTFTDENGNFNSYSYAPTGIKGEPQEVTNARATGQTGLWYVTAHGNTGDGTGLSNFVIAGPALTAKIVGVAGNEVTLTFEGEGFYAHENVALWLTDANGNVTSLGTAYATPTGHIPSLQDSNGNLITTATFLGTAAPYQITAQGITSGLVVSAPVAPLANQ